MPHLKTVLVVGDKFIPTQSYATCLEGTGLEPRYIDWAGEKAEQHALQTVMEHEGPNSVGTPVEMLENIAEAEAIAFHFAPVTRELLDAAPRLKLISVARTGVENVDVEEATRRGIGVVQALGRNAGAVAELQIGLMLAEARNIARADASVKSGAWRKDFPGARIEIHGRTVGMVGFGHVGRIFSERISGFRPRLLAFDPYASDDALASSGVERAETLDDVFRESDFVLVQARLTPETERFVGAAQFALMKPNAYFINVSRSRLVDYDALYAALAEGRISGAGLDVFDEEPLAVDDRFRALDNVTITTHFGGDTEDTNAMSARLVVEAIAEFAETGRVPRALNARELGWR
ncbi:2-hydroxyacid dehydrogenase [Arthrobacter sp. NPDC090010]|uniref:2-hydroxyacid dehydrogenase n=1 Tax=Arthrobacter sp. NPDC090010 TaxID=3363942 RepID=UPI003812163D